ncbi:hypothetical protein [Methylibium sp. T29-B]|uniref:hypothetical protein n=1 Tax=Methylibium sp. T29-B TaxID=1437443 RepID=UPI0018CC0196|nr:hypothetical protein [Methylibium sp. T29-B]
MSGRSLKYPSAAFRPLYCGASITTGTTTGSRAGAGGSAPAAGADVAAARDEGDLPKESQVLIKESGQAVDSFGVFELSTCPVENFVGNLRKRTLTA